MGNSANCVCYRNQEQEIDIDLDQDNQQILETNYIPQFTIEQDYMIILVICIINQEVNQWEQRYTHDSLAQISKVFRVNDHIKEDYELLNNLEENIQEFQLIKESDPSQGLIFKFQSVCNQIVHKVQLELPIKPLKQEVLINMIAKYNYQLKQEMLDQQQEIDNLKQLIQMYSNSQNTFQTNFNPTITTNGDELTKQSHRNTNHSKKEIFKDNLVKLDNKNIKKNNKQVQIITSNPSTSTSTNEKQQKMSIIEKENSYILKAGQSNNKKQLEQKNIENIIEENIKKNQEIMQKIKENTKQEVQNIQIQQFKVDETQKISKGIQVKNNSLKIKNIDGGDQGWVYLTPSLNKNTSSTLQMQITNLPIGGNINIGIVDMDFQKEGSLFITDFDNIGQYYVICNSEQSGKSQETEILPLDFNFKSQDELVVKFVPQEFKLKFYNLTQKKKCQIDNIMIKEKPVFAIYLYEKNTSCQILQIKQSQK